MIASLLFTWIQGADFYRNLHRDAVLLLPEGVGKHWLDVGCGPGLVSRFAAEQGYDVLGLDYSPDMIRAAQRLAKRTGSSARFETGSVFNLESMSADVVSAASLLAVMDDKQTALQSLWSAVKPGGYLLVIEPTSEMSLTNARNLLDRLPPKRRRGVLLWARAREGRSVSPRLFDVVSAERVTCTPLLEGLVNAWVLRKANQ